MSIATKALTVDRTLLIVARSTCGADDFDVKILYETRCALERADSGLTALMPAVGLTAQLNRLFRERAFWLYPTSHHRGDGRRVVRPHGRGPETVLPTGPFKGGTYGTHVNMPVPDVELNNPTFHGCLDRNAQFTHPRNLVGADRREDRDVGRLRTIDASQIPDDAPHYESSGRG